VTLDVGKMDLIVGVDILWILGFTKCFGKHDKDLI
jgi:hypothetical protein